MPQRPPKRSSQSPEERAFLERYDASAFDRPSVAVDVVLLTVTDGELNVLLIRRRDHPGKGGWSLPGGFVRLDESLDVTADRVIEAKAGLTGVFVEQLYTFGAADRDPRTRVVSVTYYALVDATRLSAASTIEDGERCMARVVVPWVGETGGAATAVDATGAPLPLAFDHADILGLAVQRIRGKLNYTPIGFQLLPETFTLRRLQVVHETVLGRPVNKDAFRRRMLATGLVEPTGERERAVGHRPAELYRFTTKSAV
ncbi:MAG: NUDIX domain-containing protein [Planctomycetes bacterium]|nr:NUDIX domain-containing protein [Planctomycetota bacterium]